MTEGGRIGLQIARFRQLCGCTQEELAEAGEISTTYLRRIERGRANPSVNVVSRLLSGLSARVTGRQEEHTLLNLGELLPFWRYRAVRETCRLPDAGAFATMGIEAEVQRQGIWRPVLILHDVTPDARAACRMVERFNRLQLSPVHLREVVEELI